MKNTVLSLSFILAMFLAPGASAQNINQDANDLSPLLTASILPAPIGSNDGIIVHHLAYPIPTYDFLSLELEGQEYTTVRIRIEDTAGNEIYELFKEVEVDPTYVGRFDMRNLENGVYFVIVENEFAEMIETIQVEKH